MSFTYRKKSALHAGLILRVTAETTPVPASGEPRFRTDAVSQSLSPVTSLKETRDSGLPGCPQEASKSRHSSKQTFRRSRLSGCFWTQAERQPLSVHAQEEGDCS